MKTRQLSMILISALMLSATACKKEMSSLNEEVTDIQAAVASTQAVALVANAGGDSIYAVNTCNRGSRRDSLAFNSLPASVTTYLTDNYAGYTARRAFSIKSSTGTAEGYVVTITFNGNPVGLKFDANGAFLKVLEQREGRDLLGHGRHGRGRFHHRGDGARRDTIALGQLPASITSYITSNYATDTLVGARKGYDSSILVISRNNGLFATIFNATGTFVSRAQLPSHKGRATTIAENALPANVTSYLSATYPNYVFSKAFSITNGATQGYVVVVEANSTKYAVQFDASGNFVKAKTIR